MDICSTCNTITDIHLIKGDGTHITELCTGCNATREIKEGTKLFTKDFFTKTANIYREEYKYYANDSTLACTKNFKCTSKECSKEKYHTARVFADKHTGERLFICVKCKTVSGVQK